MIKSAVSLTFVLMSLASVVPATAQERVKGEAADVEWLRVPKLEAGEEITLTIRGFEPARRYFVSADDSGITILNPTDRTLPGAPRAVQYAVETRARHDVAEISTRRKGRGFWGHLGPIGGYFLGSMAGGYMAGFVCQGAVGRDRCDTGAFLTGALTGGIVGAGYGFRAARRETESIIYRAPRN